MPDLIDRKRRLLQRLRAFAQAKPAELLRSASRLYAEHATVAVSHPINRLHGIDALLEGYWLPLRRALPDLERRDDVLLAGEFRGATWLAATGYYFGTFSEEWLGLPPSHQWLYLRFGEFYRVEAERIVDAYVLLDLVDVLRQLDLNPLPAGLGVESLCPGPATHDGLRVTAQDAAATRCSASLVDAMIVEGLMGYNGIDHGSIGMERYWSSDMMWYGPAGIGTTRGLTGFLRYHQHPWQEAFPDYATQPAGINVAAGLAGLQQYFEQPWQRSDPDYCEGKDLVRFAEGNYVAWNGWPSVRATHTGRSLFGVQSSGKSCTIRIMDFWRREHSLLTENWVFIDLPHMLLQLGSDVFAAAREKARRRPR